MHEVFAGAGCVDSVKCGGVVDADAQVADLFAAGQSGQLAMDADPPRTAEVAS